MFTYVSNILCIKKSSLQACEHVSVSVKIKISIYTHTDSMYILTDIIFHINIDSAKKATILQVSSYFSVFSSFFLMTYLCDNRRLQLFFKERKRSLMTFSKHMCMNLLMQFYPFGLVYKNFKPV